MTRALHLAAAISWAISPEWLSTILTIANREGSGPEAVAAELGRPLENSHAVERRGDRGDVAVIPVHGPIFRRANLFSQVSGATSVQVLATDLHLSLDADEVKAIVLDIDSPGGEANGISELAAMIYAARGRKPIVAYVGGTGASAAYWIAAACDKIYVNDTAAVGSIGVVRAMPNPNASSAKDIEIVSSQSPNKRPDISTEGGRAVVQGEVDSLADVFVSRVALYRGVGADVVLERFGRGGCLIGADAVKAGMADGLSSFEAVIAETSGAQPELGGPRLTTTTTVTTTETAHMATKLARTIATNKAEDDMPPASEPAVEPDGDEPANPAFAEGDAVIYGDRPANITSVKNGPHYGLEFTDEPGGEFAYATEGDLESASASDGASDEDEPAAEDDPADPQASTIRTQAAEIRKLRAALATKSTTQHRATTRARIDALIAGAKASRKISPAMEAPLRTLAARSLDGVTALIAAMPRLMPTASQQPVRKERFAPALTHNGKSWGEMTTAEKHAVFVEDEKLAEQMHAAHMASKAAANSNVA